MVSFIEYIQGSFFNSMHLSGVITSLYLFSTSERGSPCTSSVFSFSASKFINSSLIVLGFLGLPLGFHDCPILN